MASKTIIPNKRPVWEIVDTPHPAGTWTERDLVEKVILFGPGGPYGLKIIEQDITHGEGQPAFAGQRIEKVSREAAKRMVEAGGEVKRVEFGW